MAFKQGSPVELCELLARKEFRAQEQLRIIKERENPIISFTINMPGAVKLNEESCFVFDRGVDEIQQLCHSEGWTICTQEIHYENTGPEAIFSIDTVSPSMLKKQMLKIENHHPLGRIMDLDVLDTQGKIISRQAYDLSPRTCLLCEGAARICARSRQHSVDDLLARIKEMIDEYKHCGPSSASGPMVAAAR